MTLRDALDTLHLAGRVDRSEPGMSAWQYLEKLDEYDLDEAVKDRDPMVVGALAALAREAARDETLHVRFHGEGRTPVQVCTWSIRRPTRRRASAPRARAGAAACLSDSGWNVCGPTEPRAWAALLVALAGAA